MNAITVQSLTQLTKQTTRTRLVRRMGNEKRFAELLGNIIENCGFLEFLTRTQIDDLGHDLTLSKEIGRLEFGRRINVLITLLGERRTDIPAEEIKSLGQQLRSIAARRNEIAHAPMWVERDTCYISVSRGSDAEEKRLWEPDLEILHEDVCKAVEKMMVIFGYSK